MPKNTAAGVIIAAFIFALGFASVWHIWWLAIAGIVGAVVTAIIRTFDEDTEYVVTASDIVHREAGLLKNGTATV